MGIRQLNIQEGAEMTCGRAVMVYSGEVDVEAALPAGLDVEPWAIARGTMARIGRNFMVGISGQQYLEED
jgi:hypothetical protein